MQAQLNISTIYKYIDMEMIDFLALIKGIIGLEGAGAAQKGRYGGE